MKFGEGINVSAVRIIMHFNNKNYILVESSIIKSISNLISKNEMTGVLFILASFLFVFSSELQLIPSAYVSQVNVFVLIGSLLYTLAGVVQIHNATELDSISFKSIKDNLILWLQLFGMVLFDISSSLQILSNTFNITATEIWLSSFIGCVFFLLSGYLFTLESHQKIKWIPNFNLESITAVTNFWGCILFVISSLTAMPLLSESSDSLLASVLCGLFGAIFFIVASVYYFYCDGESRFSYTMKLFINHMHLVSICKKRMALFKMKWNTWALLADQAQPFNNFVLQEEHNY